MTNPAPGGAEPHLSNSQDDGERLQKVLAQRGWGSRRHCEELISEGRVRVNGEIAILGRRVLVDSDSIEIDGAPVGIRPELVYYLLNKPVGVITTAKDTHNRETVLNLIPKLPQVHPMGRLDAETEGLLLLTNDGELTHRITHPKFGLDKEYLVHVRSDEHGVPDSALHNLRIGVELDDGMTSPADVGQLQPGVLRIVIHEGRNRQIRRMCQQVGYPVLRLARVRIGPISDRRLRPGEFRLLTVAEIRLLVEAVTDVAHRYD
ncbi:MAG: pseudouridine synthase [Ilumatobacteraceae bacterium]